MKKIAFALVMLSTSAAQANTLEVMLRCLAEKEHIHLCWPEVNRALKDHTDAQVNEVIQYAETQRADGHCRMNPDASCK
jgi:hypothetical protein